MLMYNIRHIFSTFYIVHVHGRKMCKKDVPENKLTKQQLYNGEIIMRSSFLKKIVKHKFVYG